MVNSNEPVIELKICRRHSLTVGGHTIQFHYEEQNTRALVNTKEDSECMSIPFSSNRGNLFCRITSSANFSPTDDKSNYWTEREDLKVCRSSIRWSMKTPIYSNYTIRPITEEGRKQSGTILLLRIKEQSQLELVLVGFMILWQESNNKEGA